MKYGRYIANYYDTNEKFTRFYTFDGDPDSVLDFGAWAIAQLENGGQVVLKEITVKEITPRG